MAAMRVRYSDMDGVDVVDRPPRAPKMHISMQRNVSDGGTRRKELRCRYVA